jgi:hypothetical protein
MTGRQAGEVSSGRAKLGKPSVNGLYESKSFCSYPNL